MQRNYYQEFLTTIQNLDANRKPKLLLHVCCAPCSSHCLQVVEPYFDVTVFYYNPNIAPFEEYQKRLSEEKRFLKEAHSNVKIVEAEYDNQKFEELVKGLEDLPEGGERCKKCYRQRLEKTADFAKQNGFDCFTTTLTVSPYKHSATLNQIGGEVAERFGIKYLFSDFKKENGYQNSIEISKKYNLYRQDYCGCVYSKNLREKYKNEQKILKNTEELAKN